MGRAQCLPHAIMGHDGEALGLRLRECRIGRDDGDGGVFRRITLEADAQGIRGLGHRPSEPAELSVALEWGRPKMTAAADGPLAHDIHRDQRADEEAGGRYRAGGADTALQVGCRRAEAGPGGTERECLRCRLRGAQPHGPIGRRKAPGLVAAVEQVEQDRAGRDRHPGVAHRKAAAEARQVRDDTAGRIEAVDGAARQHQRIDALDRHFRVEQGGIAHARRPASNRQRRDRGSIEDERGDARGDARILRVANRKAGDIGDEIEHARTVHSLARRGPSPLWRARAWPKAGIVGQTGARVKACHGS